MHADPDAKLKHGLHAIAAIRELLGMYKFEPGREESIKNQVVAALGKWTGFQVLGTEVINDAGRYDILVQHEAHNPLGPNAVTRVVVELKVQGTAAAAEEQAQRYARQPDVDAVMVATTSSRLARELVVDGGASFVQQRLGGKPFGVAFLRTSI